MQSHIIIITTVFAVGFYYHYCQTAAGEAYLLVQSQPAHTIHSVVTHLTGKGRAGPGLADASSSGSCCTRRFSVAGTFFPTPSQIPPTPGTHNVF